VSKQLTYTWDGVLREMGREGKKERAGRVKSVAGKGKLQPKSVILRGNMLNNREKKDGRKEKGRTNKEEGGRTKLLGHAPLPPSFRWRLERLSVVGYGSTLLSTKEDRLKQKREKGKWKREKKRNSNLKRERSIPRRKDVLLKAGGKEKSGFGLRGLLLIQGAKGKENKGENQEGQSQKNPKKGRQEAWLLAPMDQGVRGTSLEKGRKRKGVAATREGATIK